MGQEQLAQKQPLTFEQRRELIVRRHLEFTGACDFAFDRCLQCGNDTVAEYGEKYPTAYITGCNKCYRSWCD